MKIFDLLLLNRRPHLITPSREYLFFQENEALLTVLPEAMAFVNQKDEFLLIYLNIIIESILKFGALTDYMANSQTKPLNEVVKPVLIVNDVPIYCPLFSVSNNLLIANGFGNNLTIANDTIDLFETYNFAIFESNFTSLVPVGGDEHTRAYYHYDFHTIYIVNDQGRLDTRISLFDRFIAKPDFRNVLDRIKPVLAAYYASDKNAFIAALYNEKLISSKLYNQITHKKWRNA